MSMRPDTDNYFELFVHDIPLMDVRAPVEYDKGAFPCAANIPLLDDSQRAQIGIRYKHAGQQEAIELGLQLATPKIRAQRMKAWKEFCRQNPQGYLYCFRGGLRSRTTQGWIREQGIEFPLIKGGYKAMRRYLIDELETSVERVPLVIVSGLTGSGKTRILRQISHHIDFEAIANHRGSAFGRNTSDTQPSVIDWENRVSIEFLKHRCRYPGKPVFVEDESRRIGRICMPEYLYQKMQAAPRAILEVDVDARIRLISEDYILDAWPQYQAAYADNAEIEFRRFVLENLTRIQRRLGGEKYKIVSQCFESALKDFFASNRVTGFNEGIRILLTDYYDPMYRYQLANKSAPIIFEGPEHEYLEWAEAYLST
ncbi:MAG: tRNA 2-selenouridine(34) synthase MnmH [Gammaproteobacteria bacterium]|nr:tRNA 2-selenouridine(34) synthase MnmH [Gammaproteobacteria bacterium]